MGWRARLALWLALLGCCSLPPPPGAAAQQLSATHAYLPGRTPALLPLDALGPAALTLAELRAGACATGAPEQPVVELTIVGARGAMLARQLTCSGLVAAYMQRIAALDQRLHLNSVLQLSPTAAEEAAAADELLAEVLANASSAEAAEAALPRLFCVPLLLKDNHDAAGMPTTAGTPALQGNYPLDDARVVGLLVEAGAIVLGKANMGEFAFFSTQCISSIAGVVRNPYSLAHTPAGSSGGSAAAVAASFAMAALGTDTGSSVRGPASHAGLVGIRPSLGLTSRAGLVPLRTDRDTSGPMARTVEDAVRVLEVMAVPDPADPISRLAEGVALPHNYTQFLQPGGLAGRRVGVLRQIADLPGADLGIRLLFDEALEALQARRPAESGAVLVDDFEIRGNALGNLSWDANRNGQGPAVGAWNTAAGWEDLWGCQSPFRVGLDAYLPRTLEDIVDSGQFHPATADELALALQANYSPQDWPTPAMRSAGAVCRCTWLWEDPCRLQFRQRLVESMDRENVSVLVHPTWISPPARTTDSLVALASYGGNASPFIAPHTGSPAMTVPMGYTGDAGLPAGLTFLARPFGEPELIAAGYAYEQATRNRRPPVLFPECREPPSPGWARRDDVAGAQQAGR